MFLSFLTAVAVFSAKVAAQSTSSNTPTIVCVAGQCLQGFSNITIGAKLSASGQTNSVHLLPGQYSSSTNPKLLHDLLTSNPSLNPSQGFNTSTKLPLNLVLQPGIAAYAQPLYAGQDAFLPLPSAPITSNTSITSGSIALSPNTWVALNAGGSRFVIWDSVPDVAQLPLQTASSSNTTSLSILDIQSSNCSPPCTGAGVCSPSGTCTCPSGFTGSSCESCSPGFFGPSCQKCPTNCAKCDDGMSGSGRCLVPSAGTSDPASCQCLNGVCGANGQCQCNAGFTTATNGTQCAKCSTGFFQTSTGDCQVCQLGCASCADGNGVCTACKPGFTQDANDRTKCTPAQSITSTGTICPDGSFANGNTCQPCSPLCQTCTGGTSNDCVICGAGRFALPGGGGCVTADQNGVCTGSNGLIADNNKHACDSCGAKCTTCAIPNFNVASTASQRVCTGCLPGSVLFQGQCIAACPSGTFLSPKDNLTCTPCDSTCTTCAGSATTCLTCSNNQLASQGKCVTSCPSGTFSSGGACVACHADCASCSGAGFNQCSACPASRPALVSGRCLPTCAKNQYFDKTSGSCQSCDSSCSSCSGPGTQSCLACNDANSVLKAGSCVSAQCTSSTKIVPGLGICLSDLVVVPSTTNNTSTPLPIVPGLNTPSPTGDGRRLEWWEILLMALGCAFIFLVVVWLWRRRMKRVREDRTRVFATQRGLDDASKMGWGWRIVRMFGGGKRKKEEMKMTRRDPEMGAYQDFPEEKRYRDSLSTYYAPGQARQSISRDDFTTRYRDDPVGQGQTSPDLTEESIYSQVTGLPRRVPEPRQPLKSSGSRGEPSVRSGGSGASSVRTGITWSSRGSERTDAERYRDAWERGKEQRTGGSTNSGGSKNPFLR